MDCTELLPNINIIDTKIIENVTFVENFDSGVDTNNIKYVYLDELNGTISFTVDFCNIEEFYESIIKTYQFLNKELSQVVLLEKMNKINKLLNEKINTEGKIIKKVYCGSIYPKEPEEKINLIYPDTEFEEKFVFEIKNNNITYGLLIYIYMISYRISYTSIKGKRILNNKKTKYSIDSLSEMVFNGSIGLCYGDDYIYIEVYNDT
jgi:hypothetical protein